MVSLYIVIGAIVATIIASIFHYMFSGSCDIWEFLFESNGLYFPFLFGGIAASLICAIYVDMVISIIAGATFCAIMISSAIHYCVAYSSDIWEFLFDDGGLYFPILFLGIGASAICAIYVDMVISIVAGVAFLIFLLYVGICSLVEGEDFWGVLWDCGGWIVFLLVSIAGATVVCAVYVNMVISITVGAVIFASVIALIIQYVIFDSEGFLFFPVLFSVAGATVICAVYVHMEMSVIIGITLCTMLIASAIHYLIADSCDIIGFLFDDGGWFTSLFVIVAGATVACAMFFNSLVSITIGATIEAILIYIIVYVILSDNYDLPEFFEEAGLLLLPALFIIAGATVICAVYLNTAISITLGVMLAAIAISSTIHYYVMDCYDLESFFFEEYGWFFPSLFVIAAGSVIGAICVNVAIFIILGVVLEAALITLLVYLIKKEKNNGYQSSIPVVTPTVTPKATPTVTPKATPTVTPKVTPTVTPKVTPPVTPPKKTDTTPIIKPTKTTVTIDDTPIVVEENKPGELILDTEQVGVLVIDTDDK